MNDFIRELIQFHAAEGGTLDDLMSEFPEYAEHITAILSGKYIEMEKYNELPISLPTPTSDCETAQFNRQLTDLSRDGWVIS